MYPGGGRAWNRAETRTRHSPGIQPADVEELAACAAAAVVLSQATNKELQIHPDTCRYLQGRSIAVHLAETGEAVKIYHDLTAGTLVAGLFYSACWPPFPSASTQTAAAP